jgi:2-keto-4-pentenoate hydratase/2-oxohepta-3-ene-1,7-dioic acid hydratase in catechol pathway
LFFLDEERDMTQRWVRFSVNGAVQFGTLTDDVIDVYIGDMFSDAQPTGTQHALAQVKLLAPTVPSKVVALWNNFMALAEKLGLQTPLTPLYFLKSPNSYLNPNEPICAPAGEHKIVFEGELGIVIGRACKAVTEDDASEYVFGYTCANDVTAADILNADATFAQWVRAKGFDTFCPLGPVIATGLDAATLRVKTTLNGQLRQDFPISDMRFSVARLVSSISHDMTLNPGDVILCGTSIGVGSMKPGSTVSVDIDGIGTLTNTFI